MRTKHKAKKLQYVPSEIEPKWQQTWEAEKLYQPDLDTSKKPFYTLMMFPYPSAEGLHVGSMYTFSGVDAYARFKRMQGYDVFEPIGLDGFGIHSENYALKTGRHPMEQADITEENYYRQLHEIGNSFDWSRTVETYKPEYYQWTQWLFLELFKAGLAYKKKAPVNFCPSCKTVLADEQVIDGKCERCGSIVEKRDLAQWFFRITNYSERLLTNLKDINWSEKVKIAQKNWIGKSEGATIEFRIENSEFRIEVFTTRPDTLYGATFLVVSPEHPIVAQLVSSELTEVTEYIKKAKNKTAEERRESKDKSGVFSGFSAIHPLTGEKLQIWIADYVLMGYGTGAIMAVPAHDERDYAFAKKYDLQIKQVIADRKQNYVVVHGCPGKKEENMDLGQTSTTKHWIPWIRKALEGTHAQVYVPIMPTPWEPKYTEWKDAFEKLHIDENSVIIAHSCGAAFVVRWLGETKRQIKRLILVAPAKISAQDSSQAIKDFYDFQIDAAVKDRIGEVIIFTSDTEEERHKRSAKLYFDILGGSVRELKRRGHFTVEQMGTEEFPELLLAAIGEVYTGEGEIINSEGWNGWQVPENIDKIIDWLGKKGVGKREEQYHLRDWLISRQRYWGPPIPMIHCQHCEQEKKSWFTLQKKEEQASDWNHYGWYPVPETDLPVKLPYVEEFKPLGTGVSPLASVAPFYEVKCPGCSRPAKRETDVSDTFLDSAWYFFRYIATEYTKKPFDLERVKKWLPVTIYIGGAEHAVLHLLYARFITMVLHDLNFCDFEEPFERFYAHGLIIKDGAKMSKSKGNVIVPDEYIRKYGADTLRTYLRFIGPFEDGGDFRDSGIEGMYKFLKRVWTLMTVKPILHTPLSGIDKRKLHQLIKNVTDDYEQFRYNTVIAKLMTYYNDISGQDQLYQESAEVFLKLLAPFAPHITEELYQTVILSATKGLPPDSSAKPVHANEFHSIHRSLWPTYDPAILVQDIVRIIIQQNSKVRDIMEIPASKQKDRGYVEEHARKSEKLLRNIAGKQEKKILYIPGKVINFITE
jgi:leucyl-tRNA synthetase